MKLFEYFFFVVVRYKDAFSLKTSRVIIFETAVPTVRGFDEILCKKFKTNIGRSKPLMNEKRQNLKCTRINGLFERFFF